MTENGPSKEHLMVGLVGCNPLAFLASVGTLRILTRRWSEEDIKMSWKRHQSQWRPVLNCSSSKSKEDVVAALHNQLEGQEDEPFFTMPSESGDERDNLSDLSAEGFRRLGRLANDEAKPNDRKWADFCAAYGTDISTFEDDDQIADTDLRTMSGAGHQHFLGYMREIAQKTDREDYRKALFNHWEYEDEKPAMRWDPHDDRRHALRAEDPAKDEIYTVRGANRLAIEGLPLFPTIPTQDELKTRAFHYSWRSSELSWPIWGPPINLDTLNSLLSYQEITEDKPDLSSLAMFGVEEVYRSERVNLGGGRYRNFTMGEAVGTE